MSEPKPPARPDLGSLAVAAFRTAVARQPMALAAWGALLVFGLGLDLVARRGGIALDGSRLDAGFITYTALDSAASALISGLALHVFLTGRPPARLHGGYFAFAAVVAVAEIAWLTLFYFGTPAPAAQANPDPATAARAAVMLVLVVLGGFATIRLLLWPIGLLVGRPPATPAQSWRLMRGMVGSYIGASILVGLPVVLMGIALSALAGGEGPGATTLLRFMDVGLTAVGTALSAEVWRRRAGDETRRLGEVFK